MLDIPTEISCFPEAVVLWPKLLRRTKPEHLSHFGIRDLAQRLEWQVERERRKNGGQTDQRARAEIWRHVAEQCAEGKGEIPPTTEEALRYWTLGGERKPQRSKILCSNCRRPMRVSPDSRFSSCRTCRGEARRREKVERSFKRTGELPEGWKLCERCDAPFQSPREDSRYCSQRCQKRSYREKRQNRQSVSPGVRDNVDFRSVTA